MRAKVIAGIVLLGVAACAPKKDSGAKDTTASAAPTPNVVSFTAKDFAFAGPDSIPAGMTTVVLHNEGSVLHHLQLVRLTDGKTEADLAAGLQHMKPTDPPPPWMHFVGGANAADPGAETQATLALQPGNYALVCLVDIPDHVPHMMKGMIKALTVTPSSAPEAPAPTPDLTLTLTDYAFSFSSPPTAGKHVIKVQNNGPQPHEFELIRLLPGKTLDDVMQWAQTYQGPMPFTSLGGAPGLEPGDVEYVTMDLTPGQYVALCFFPDAKDGKPHFEHGMELPFTIS